MSYQIQISVGALKAALQYVDKKKVAVNPRIGGVFIEANSGETRAVATDGAILGVFKEKHENRLEIPVKFIIPYVIVDEIKATKYEMDYMVNFEPAGNGMMTLGMPSRGKTIEFEPMKHCYPDYRFVIPKHEDFNNDEGIDGYPQLDERLLTRVRKSLQIFFGGDGRYHLLPSGREGAVRIEFYRLAKEGHKSFVGVIMPLRADGKRMPYKWVFEEMDAPEMDAPEMDAPEMDAPEMDAPVTDAPEMDAPEMDAPEMDAGSGANEECPTPTT